jgi:alkanesulfonate monooxygenase SsuD/methylene tetrahydromethanopterin reductase-like flavin-dependent oxidoreductase (luciferase family)
MRFGVITSHAPDGLAWRGRARRAETLGYTSLLMPDHFQDQWAPLVALTIAAEATERIRVGTLVFDNDYRHPVVLAKEIATLDLATSGRVEFGLGAGWKRSDYDEAGMSYDPPGVRISRMVEGLEVMKRLGCHPIRCISPARTTRSVERSVHPGRTGRRTRRYVSAVAANACFPSRPAPRTSTRSTRR